MSFIFRSGSAAPDVLTSYFDVANALARCLAQNRGGAELTAEQLKPVADAVEKLKKDAEKFGPTAQVLVGFAQQLHEQLKAGSIELTEVLDLFQDLGRWYIENRD
jgi:hypothetical protein